MRICQIISRLAATPEGTLVGGPPNTMVKLARQQVSLGHDLSLLAGCPRGPSVKNAKRAFPEFNLHAISVNGESSGVLRGAEFFCKGSIYVLRHRKIMKKQDIFHSHSGYHQLAALTSAIRKATSVPSVHTLYCPIITEIEERKNPFMVLKTARIAFSAVDRVIAISKNIERSLLNAGIEAERIRVIPPGIDTRRFHPDVSRHKWRKKLAVPDDGLLVVYLGNLVKAKGLDVLIEALKRIVSELPKVYFAYALQKQHPRFEPRRKEYRDNLNRICLKGTVRELGPVLNIEELMAAADVFVSPLRTTDGLADYPISIMEAMAVGRPVVTTPVGGVREFVTHEDNGLFASPGSSSDLADSVLRVLTSPKLSEELGRNARRFIVANFGMAHIVDLTMNLYTELV